MAQRKQTLGRYQIRDRIGQGSMGVVDRAYDPVLRQEVAIKTLYGAQDMAVLDLFKRECSVLSGIGGHPNVMEILDIGETDSPSGRRPYFVMPLLTGVTLEQWMHSSTAPPPLERTVQVIAQIARGLQAAHDQGLLHRDLKPSNIFVQEDDSIKIMDFGVACLTGQRTMAGSKRTQLYTSPEQLMGNRPAATTDQFSLAVISYELLTGKHPFSATNQQHPTEAILAHQPAACSDLNPRIPAQISQVVDKALAKEPAGRFGSVREYAASLEKALRGEAIDVFNTPQVDPRLVRAQQALAEGDVTGASNLIRELKSETYLNTQVHKLDRDIAGVLKNYDFQQLLIAAKHKIELKEYAAALETVQEVLAKDPAHEKATALKHEIETAIAAGEVDAMLSSAQRHYNEREYTRAQEIVGKLSALAPADARVEQLSQEIDRALRREIEQAKLADASKREAQSRREAEIQSAYEAALRLLNRGDVDTEHSGLEAYLAVEATDGASLLAGRLQEDLQRKRQQLRAQQASVRRHLSEQNYAAARAGCEAILQEYPDNIAVKELLEDIEEGEKTRTAALSAKPEPVAQAPTPQAPVSQPPPTVEEITHERAPEVTERPHAADPPSWTRSRNDLVASMEVRARSLEESGKHAEALAQWETLKAIHSAHPGVDAEIERLGELLREQARQAVKMGWLAKINQAVSTQNYEHATKLLSDALAQFPGDPELSALEASIPSSGDPESEQLVANATGLYNQGHSRLALNLLRSAPSKPVIRKGLTELLLRRAAGLIQRDWVAAETLVTEASLLDPGNSLAENLSKQIAEKKMAAPSPPASPKPQELRKEPPLKSSPATNPDVPKVPVTPESSLDEILERTRIFQPVLKEDAIIDRGKGTPPKTQPAEPAPPPRVIPTPAPMTDTKTPKISPQTARYLGYGIAGGLAAGLLVYLGITFFQKSAQEQPSTSSMIPISMAGTPDSTYRIEDAAGKDVTAQALGAGIPAGAYHLSGTRPGFAPVDLSFTVNPGEKSHPLEPLWTLLPAQLVVRSSQPGSLIIDETPVAPSDSGDFEKAIGSGHHHVAWNSGRTNSEFDLDVSEGGITQSNWGTQIAGFAAITDLHRIRYDSRRLPVKINTAKAEPAGARDLPPPGQTVGVEISPGRLLQLARVDDSRYSGEMLVVFLPESQSARPPKVSPRPQKSSAPVVVPPPAPARVEAPPPVQEKAAPKESAIERLKRRAGQQP